MTSISVNSTFVVWLQYFLALIFVSFAAATDFHGVVFDVRSKLTSNERSVISRLKAHDSYRHFYYPLATGVDISVGGSGRPNSLGLYYTKIGIGTPSKEYYVQVDTGSDITWINGIQCQECLKKGYRGMDLTPYDQNASFTGKPVTCHDQICKDINKVNTVHGCTANASCLYHVSYGDGSESSGYMVKDVIQYNSVSGDMETRPENANVSFGCGTIQSGNLNSQDDAFDGILGFGNTNASVISQLASSGKVKKMFAHCLKNGGGIFAIGHVIKPKVNSAHLIPNEIHYTINVTGIAVGAEFLNLSIDSNGTVKRKAIIDSGTTLVYLPKVIYTPLVDKIVSRKSLMGSIVYHDSYTCIEFDGSVDDEFPVVTFHFENSLSSNVYPHDYLFSYGGLKCLGWQMNDMDPSIRDKIVLGDLILSNKLVLYDLENQTIGWAEYNCSSNITLKDDITGGTYLVSAHNLSSAFSLINSRFIRFLVLISVLIIHAI